MFTFLFGAPKSGKTAYIMDKIRENIQKGQKTYLLVPEQQLFISECMLRDLPASSALYFEAISFSRLCEIVFSKYGGLADASVGSGIKNLIMWKSLRSMSGQLLQYNNVRTDGALVEMMLSSVDELHANKISPKDCEDAAALCEDPILSRKLEDIAAIYALYTEKLMESVGDGELLNEDKLHRLALVLSKESFFSDTEIFIDSFTDFTKEEFDVIEAIIRQAKACYMSFTYKRGAHAPHTYTLSDTVKRLTRFVKENAIPTNEITLGENDGKDSELDIIERYLWDFGATLDSIPNIPEQNRGNVESYVCENEYEEAWLCALNIIKAHESGVKYSEMAVISRNPENRQGLIEAVFENAGIPFFYSSRTDLSATAPARLVLSALRCVYRNFNASDVINLLKTGLCGIDDRKADLFEDYCNTWAINGKMFRESVWSMNPDGYTTETSDRGRGILLAANEVRDQLISPLLSLEKALRHADGNTLESCRALHSYLDRIKLSQSLSDAAEYSLSCGDVKEAGELLRVYSFILSALTDICSVMGDEKMSVEELFSAIEIMLKNTDMGSVPAINDCVTIGSAATLRIENVKTAFLLGLCEGEFPATYSDSGILSENDKQNLDKVGISLASREQKIISDELFYVYRAMTKPQDKLVLSTCRASVSGGALSPSTAWSRVHFLLPHLKDKKFDLDRVRTLAQLLQGSDKDPEADGTEMPEVNDGSRDENVVHIDPSYVRLLFGDNLHLSKSKITTFVECPYKYWCEYGLKLREQQTAKISYDNAGTIIHYVLENLVKSRLLEDGSISPLSIDELIDYVNRLLNDYVSNINCPLPPYMLHSFSRLRDLALIMAQSVMAEFAQSSFKVVGLEKRISAHVADALKPMMIPVSETEELPVVSLGGVIDRVDCYDDGKDKYIRVIDYKTGSHTFNIKKVATGEDVQLPAYLFTAALSQNNSIFGASDDKTLIPAAAMFLSAEETGGHIDPVRRGFMLGEVDLLRAASADLNSKMLAGITVNKDGTISQKSKAALDRDAIDALDQTLRSTVAKTAREMYSGIAPRTPSDSACKFCSVKSSCPVANKSKE